MLPVFQVRGERGGRKARIETDAVTKKEFAG